MDSFEYLAVQHTVNTAQKGTCCVTICSGLQSRGLGLDMRVQNSAKFVTLHMYNAGISQIYFL